VGDPSAQVHDFEPGIKPSGLFWTIPVPPSAGVVYPHAGTARFRMQNVAVPDFHDFFNAISPFPSTLPAHVSFDVRWSGGGGATQIRDPVFGFEGTYIGGEATILFRAYDDTRRGVIFTSNPGGQTTVGAGVGSERNGVFFV
jgi:hypothetical protein